MSLLSSRDAGRRPLHIARWSAGLLYYNFDVVCQRSCDNAVADALSRLPVTSAAEPGTGKEVISIVSSCTTKEQVQEETVKNITL